MCKIYFLFFSFLFSFFCFGAEIEVCSDNVNPMLCEISIHSSRDNRDQINKVYITEKKGKVLSSIDSGYDTSFMLFKRGAVYLLQYSNGGNLKGYDYLFFKVEDKDRKVKIISFLSFDEQIDYKEGGSYWSAVNCVNNSDLQFDDLFSAGWSLCNSLIKQPVRERVKYTKDGVDYVVSIKELGSHSIEHNFLFSHLDFSDISNAKDLTKIIDGENNLSGIIGGKYYIDVHLNKSNNVVIGSYNYKGKSSIGVTGNYNDDSLVMDEWVNGKKNATFKLDYQGGFYSGYWSNANKKLSTKLYKMVF